VLTYGARGLAIAAVAAILLLILSKFVNIHIDLIRVSASILVAGLSIGMIWALLLPLSMFDAAFACDVHLGLKERITSALEFSKRPDPNPLVPALIADADRHACRIRPMRDFPLRRPREVMYALVFLAACVGIYFLPPWRYVMASEEQKQEYAAVQEQAKQVREMAHEITINPPAERSDVAEEIARDLQELARDMDLGTLTRSEALQRLSAIEEKIQQSQEASGYNDLQQRISRMAQALRDNEDLSQAARALQSGDTQTAQESLNKLAEKLETGQVPSRDYERLARSLEQAANSLNGNQQSQELSNNLSQAASDMRAAAAEAAASQQMDPATMAAALIEAINKAIPEIESLNIPQETKDQARQILESVRADLQAKIDSGQVTQQDISAAMDRLRSVREMLEQAGADLGGNQQSAEDVARQLRQEAQNLLDESSSMQGIDPQVLSQAQETLRSVVSDLEQDINEGTTSEQSNSEAQQKIDQARQALEQAGMTEAEARKLKQEAEDLMQQASGMQSIDPTVRSQAMTGLQDIADRLGEQISQHSATPDSNAEASAQIEQIRQQLEDARPTDEVARELQQEAQNLMGMIPMKTDLPESQRNQMTGTCRNIADKLGQEIAQGNTSHQSNQEARRQLDQIEQQLGSNSSCLQSGQQGSQGNCSQGKCQGMNGLFGMCQGGQGGSSGRSGQGSRGSRSGSQGQPGQSSQSNSNRAGACNSLRRAGGSCNSMGSSLRSGQCFGRCQSRLGSCRRGLGGQCNNPRNGGQSGAGNAASGWGVGSTPYETGGSQVANRQWNGNTEDPTGTEHDTRQYQGIYNPQFEQSQSFQTQVNGKETDVGGSLMFTEVTDPQTGETSSVPYFDLQPSDLQSLMDSVENQEVPRSYQDLVRFYFEQLTGGARPAE
jgi:hypothetical protein